MAQGRQVGDGRVVGGDHGLHWAELLDPADPVQRDDEAPVTVRVWAPAAGIPIRLKVEDAADPTKSVETEATTTVANAWETLTFDFANQARTRMAGRR